MRCSPPEWYHITMLIYRVENPTTGDGPYQHWGQSLSTRLNKAHSGPGGRHLRWNVWLKRSYWPFGTVLTNLTLRFVAWVLRKPPTQRYYTTSSSRAGFASLNDLYTWFDGFLPDLEDAGYTIVAVKTRLVFSYQAGMEEPGTPTGLPQLMYFGGRVSHHVPFPTST